MKESGSGQVELKNLIKTFGETKAVDNVSLVIPDGAYCCGEFYDCDDLKKNKLSTSFGMPSGHSQCAWIFASYFIYLLLQNKKTNNYVKSTSYYK